MKANSSLGLYIHIPYCLRKCPYCDFFSQAIGSCGASAVRSTAARAGKPNAITARDIEGEVPDSFISALKAEILQRSAAISAIPLDSVYFGGGTPSLLNARQFGAIMETVRQGFELRSDCEISLEANPGSLRPEKLEAYRAAGLNRLSLGAQSFVPSELQTLGRCHDVSDNQTAIKIIRESGLVNFSLDLIIGVPGQTMASLNHSLEQLIKAGPTHVSAYILQVEETTPMGRQMAAGRLQLPEDEEIASMYYQVLDILAASGYRQYEISNHARPGQECRHNLRYWQADQYLGVGPGAVSLQGPTRLANNTPLEAYLKGALLVEELESMNPAELAVDALILALRRTRGVDLRAFEERFKWDLQAVYPAQIKQLEEAGLLTLNDGFMALTRNALIISNQVFLAFMP